jgi:hypothetical protein
MTADQVDLLIDHLYCSSIDSMAESRSGNGRMDDGWKDDNENDGSAAET